MSANLVRSVNQQRDRRANLYERLLKVASGNMHCKNLGEIPTGSLPIGAPNRGRVGLDRQFSTNI